MKDIIITQHILRRKNAMNRVEKRLTKSKQIKGDTILTTQIIILSSARLKINAHRYLPFGAGNFD